MEELIIVFETTPQSIEWRAYLQTKTDRLQVQQQNILLTSPSISSASKNETIRIKSKPFFYPS